MFFRDEGSGDPVLLVHGLGASSRVFDALFDARNPAQRLLAVDLPRTGRSGHWAASQPEAIADALAKFLEERGLSSVHLFGHSFGGLVCLALAARHAHVARSLTVASAPALGLPLELRLWLDHPFADLAYGLLGRTPASRAMLQGYLGLIWGRLGTLSGEHLNVYEAAQAAPGFGEGVLEALRSIGRFRIEPDALSQASFPKVVLWGDRDPLVPASAGARIAQAIGGRFEVIEGVGHCLPDERPDVVARAVERCLSPSVDEAA